MLGKVAQRYSGHSATGNSVVTLSFPITKCALWDHTPTGSTVNVHLAYYRNIEINVEKKVLQLAQRYADDSGKNRYHCLLTGSILAEIDGEGVKILLDRFDPGRENSGFNPTTVPGDISIPCIMQKQEDHAGQASVSDYITVLKMLEHRCSTNDKVELSNFFILKCTSSYSARATDVSLAMEFDFITLATGLKATPISTVPIMPTALSKNLMGPMNMSNLQGEPKMGYLTMDHTRKLLLILQSDPKVQTLPLVGIWVTGVRYIYDPYVWCSCLRYLHNNSIRERVCTAPEPFLVALFSPLHSKPEFYECMTEDKTSRLKFELNTCLESVELNQCVQYRQDDCLVFDLQRIENGAKMAAFTSATEALKQAIPEKDKPQKPLTEVSVNIDDLMPRSSPLPQQTKAPMVMPQVPEVSLLFDDEGPKAQPSRLPLGYSVFKQQNDENSPIMSEPGSHRNKSAQVNQSSSVRAPLKPINRDMNSNTRVLQTSKSNRDSLSSVKSVNQDSSRRISLESKSDHVSEDYQECGSPSGYFGVGSLSVSSQSQVPNSHGMRMRSPNMVPTSSQAGQYGMRYTSPPYMGPRQPYMDQYYHPGMQMQPGSTGSPPGMYPMPQRGGYQVRNQMAPRHPYGNYMPRPYPGQYGPRGPPVTGPGQYYPQQQGNRYPVPPYRPAQYRSSPPQPMNTCTSTSDHMVPPPRNIAHELQPHQSSTMPTSQQHSSTTSTSATTATLANPAVVSSSSAEANVISSSRQISDASPCRDNKPHGAIPPLTPSTGDPSLPLSSPGSVTNTVTEKSDETLAVNGVAVTPEVYQLLKQQDAKLKHLQAQLQKLLANQEPKELEPEGKPQLDSSSESYQSIMQKFQSTPSKKSCSIATNTSLFFSGPASPQRSRLVSRDIAEVKLTDSCSGKHLSLGSETIVAEHQPSSLGVSIEEVDDDDETTNATGTMSNNNSFTFSMQMMTLQEGTIDSSLSDMIVDLPCYDTGSGGDDPESQEIQSVSMYGQQDTPPVMPCDIGDEQLVPGKEDNSREYYENLIGNIHDLLNKIPAGQQGNIQRSVNCSLVDQEPVRDIAMATLEHLKKIGIYNEQDDNDGVNKTLINLESAVLHKINYVSMMFDDNSDTDVSMEVNALAMKYLSDDQLSQMAKLSTNSRARRAARSSKNILQRVMHNKAADQSSNVTLYGMGANNMSFATTKYMERYGLLDNVKSGTNSSLCLGGVDADDTCANMSVLNQEYLRVPPLAWHNTSLDTEPSKLVPSDCAETYSKPVFGKQEDNAAAAKPHCVQEDDTPIFPNRFLPVVNPTNDYDHRDSYTSRGRASSASSDCACSSFCGDSCASDEFCPGCMPRARSDTMPLESTRRAEKEQQLSEGGLKLHDSCPDFAKDSVFDDQGSLTRSPVVTPAVRPDSVGLHANTTADSASTTDREVRKILEKPIGSFETDTVFTVDENCDTPTADDDDDGFRVFDRPAREMKREPLPQQPDIQTINSGYYYTEESVCETILDIQRLKQLPKLL